MAVLDWFTFVVGEWSTFTVDSEWFTFIVAPTAGGWIVQASLMFVTGAIARDAFNPGDIASSIFVAGSIVGDVRQ